VKSPGSFEWRRDQVSAAIQAQAKASAPPGTKDSSVDVYVSETYQDFVIVRDYSQNKWWKIPYSIDEKNAVTLGEATEVAQTWTDITKSIRMLVPVEKADTPPHMRQISYGVVLEPTTEDAKKADLQGDCVKAEDVELAAHGFMERWQTVGDMHKSAVAGAKIIETYLAPVDFVVETADGPETVLKGSWVLAVKWPNEQWKKIAKGEYTGYSVGGFGMRTPITDAEGTQQTTVSKAADGTQATVALNWLWGMDIQEVSGVTKGANGKKFFILKSTPDADPNDMPGSITKADGPPLFGWVRDALRKVAGASGPTDGGTEMTPEDVKKAVTESLAEGLAPFEERIKKLEDSATEPAPAAEEGAAVAKTDDEAAAAEPTADEVTKTTIAEGIKEGLKPLEERIGKLESAAGQRQSGLEEGGAHPVAKNADGEFSWAGSGIL